MAAPSPSPSQVSLKLYIDKKAKKVLFAEAGKETVDFLCSILTLPVGTVIRLLEKEGMVGCLSNLYKSIECLNDGYIQPDEHKDTVLKPMASSSSFNNNPLVHQILTSAPHKKNKFYGCGSHYTFVGENCGALCPSFIISSGRHTSCNKSMTSEVMVVVNANPAGLVKGMITYMVMDDLAVAPLTTSTLLTMCNATNTGALMEKVVDLDMDKALKLLKVSLFSNLVLTTVFYDDFISKS